MIKFSSNNLYSYRDYSIQNTNIEIILLKPQYSLVKN